IDDLRVARTRQIGDEVVRLGDAVVKRQARLRAEAVPEKVVDLGNGGRRKDQAAGLRPDDVARAIVPVVAAIVVGVDDPRVEDHPAVPRLALCRRAAGATDSPKPLLVSTRSASAAVSVRPLANAPSPGGPACTPSPRYTSTASRTSCAIGRPWRATSAFSRI